MNHASFYTNLSRRYLHTPRTADEAFRTAEYATAVERHRDYSNNDGGVLTVLFIMGICVGLGIVIGKYL